MFHAGQWGDWNQSWKVGTNQDCVDSYSLPQGPGLPRVKRGSGRGGGGAQGSAQTRQDRTAGAQGACGPALPGQLPPSRVLGCTRLFTFNPELLNCLAPSPLVFVSKRSLSAS